MEQELSEEVLKIKKEKVITSLGGLSVEQATLVLNNVINELPKKAIVPDLEMYGN